MTYHIAFDLDGTLLAANGRVNWEDEASIKARTSHMMPECWTVTDLRAFGWRVSFVTNRSEAVRGVTEEQLAAAFPWFDPASLYMRDTSLGWEEGFQHKVAALRGLGVGVYVGDLESDADAARVAGWGFLHAASLVGNLDVAVLLHPTRDEHICSTTGEPLRFGLPSINQEAKKGAISPQENAKSNLAGLVGRAAKSQGKQDDSKQGVEA